MRHLYRLAAILWLTAAHSSAFEPPSVTEREAALGPLDDEPLTLQRLLIPDEDFPAIHIPKPGDWLSSHPESGQTFEKYCSTGFNRPGSTRHVIYLLPMGDFSADAQPSLNDLRTYAEVFFQLEVKLLPSTEIAASKFTPRINVSTQKRQLLSTDILNFLKTQLPADAYCLLGVTMEDLYPAKSWNYVFGQASLLDRVGVYSFARYDPAFFGRHRTNDYRQLILQRSCKVLAHETGHMFGLLHCTYFECLMNGSNNLEETDAGPQHLCPICLRKLLTNVRFNAVTRYQELARFYRDRGWEDDARWTERQLAKAGISIDTNVVPSPLKPGSAEP